MISRSFAFPLGLGNDICHIPRIYKILTSKRGPRFVERVLTDRERSQGKAKWVLQCVSLNTAVESPKPLKSREEVETVGNGVKRDPDFWKAAEFMAGRFAAKEATIKAHHQQRLTFHDIEITHHVPTSSSSHNGNKKADVRESTLNAELKEGSGFEDVRSSGPPLVTIKKNSTAHPQNACLSISHDGDYATAVCLCISGGLGIAAG